MPRIVTVPLSLEQREQLILLTKHAAHWRERQRAQTILWLSEGKTDVVPLIRPLNLVL